MVHTDPEQAELDALLGKKPNQSSKDTLREQADAVKIKLLELPGSVPAQQKAMLMLDLSGLLVALETNAAREESWQYARQAFDILLSNENWAEAVKACDILFEADQPASVVALANGVWLAVTWPIPAELTVRMLEHIIDDTPKNSDGAAVAAICAHYIADIRSPNEEKRNSLMFMTENLVTSVAQRHGKVTSQTEMELWLERLQLLEPATFLPRLGRILDLMASDQWWYDKDKIRAKLP